MHAIVLLSGGIDSAACVAFYKQLGHDVSGLFIDYGQPVREQEERSAAAIAAHYKIPFTIVRCTGPETNYTGPTRRIPLNSAVPTAFSNPRMRASRSSPEPQSPDPFDLAVCACPFPPPSVGRVGLFVVWPWLPLRPSFEPTPRSDVLAFLFPFLPESRIPLRQFSGSAQADNAGILTGWRYWSKSTQIGGCRSGMS